MLISDLLFANLQGLFDWIGWREKLLCPCYCVVVESSLQSICGYGVGGRWRCRWLLLTGVLMACIAGEGGRICQCQVCLVSHRLWHFSLSPFPLFVFLLSVLFPHFFFILVWILSLLIYAPLVPSFFFFSPFTPSPSTLFPFSAVSIFSFFSSCSLFSSSSSSSSYSSSSYPTPAPPPPSLLLLLFLLFFFFFSSPLLSACYIQETTSCHAIAHNKMHMQNACCCILGHTNTFVYMVRARHLSIHAWIHRITYCFTRSHLDCTPVNEYVITLMLITGESL